MILSNAEIADRLASLAQLLSVQKENPYKIRAYQRAAARIRTLSESLDEMVRTGEDLTRYAGIGEAIASAIREIVLTGALGKLEKLRAEAAPAVKSLSDFLVRQVFNVIHGDHSPLVLGKLADRFLNRSFALALLSFLVGGGCVILNLPLQIAFFRDQRCL